MKKISFYAVLAVATLASVSCSSDDVLVQSPSVNQPIEFGAYTGRSAALAPTRAHSVETLDTLALDGGFGVFAYYTNDVDYSQDATPNFMYNQQVTSDDNGVNWGYSPLKYWPNEEADKVTFFAYAPYADHKNTDDNFEFSTNEANGDPIITFTVNDEVQKQQDLLYGVRESDGHPYLNMDKMKVSDQLTFHFRHALSRIGFKVQAMIDHVNSDQTGAADKATDNSENIDDATTISVQKVELIGNFYTTRKLNLNNGYANNPNWGEFTTNSGGRIFVLDSDDFTEIANSVNTTKKQLNTGNAWVMVIPQQLDAQIRVTYTVTTTDNNLSASSVVENVITSEPFNFNFEHGKSYMFNLHLGLTSVKFDASVEKWEDAGETTVNVPINFN